MVPSMTKRLSALPFALSLLTAVCADDTTWNYWCGKHYQYGAPVQSDRLIDAAYFPYPELSSTPLLDFACVTKSSFYLSGDDANDPPMMIVDANITHDVGSAYHTSSSNLTVSVYYGSTVVASGSVAPGSMGNLLSLSLSNISAIATPHNFTCQATTGDGQKFHANTTLAYRNAPSYGGGPAKVDRLTGATLVRNVTSGSKEWTQMYPVGFFDEVGQNSTLNPAFNGTDRLYQAYQSGFNIIHVRPALPPPDVLATYLDLMEKLGLYFTFDMSNVYTNLTALEDSVMSVINRTNLIGWYTGDEPDGQDPAYNATRLAYDLIYELDGYHPVGVTLNCENYRFIDYGINGADQIRVDPYPINLNGAFSRKYGTPCNSTYGVCGCDSCEGSIYDITTRVDSARNRARLLGNGMGRIKSVWGVPQSFDDLMDTFWTDAPSGASVATQMVVSLNHGAVGITPFDAPGSHIEYITNASVVANLLTGYSQYFTTYAHTRTLINTTLTYQGINNMDIAMWTVSDSSSSTDSSNSTSSGSKAMVVAANFFLGGQTFLLNFDADIVNVVFGNVTAVNGTAQFVLPYMGTAAVELQL